MGQRRFADALECFRRAHDLGARGFDVDFGLGSALLDTHQEAAAIVELERAAALQPRHAGVLQNLAKAQYLTGLVDEAVATFRAALAVDDDVLHRSALATVIPGAPSATHADVLAARRAFAESDLPTPRFRFPPKRSPGPLRVGYLSSFFESANWMKPVWGLVNAHDRNAVAVHLLSDATEEECAAAGYRPDPRDAFVTIRGLDNERAAERIAAAELDLLVDLNGYSALGRLPVVAYRPARAVVAWFNHYATSGMTAYDCLIGDSVVVHADEEAHYIERIERVPGTYLTFDVAYAVPPVEPAPARRNGHVTFGCFASQYKLTPLVVSAWAAILDGAPEAKLLVKNRTMQADCNRVALLQRFTDHGVDPARVTLEPGAPHYDYLAAYARVDVALDPFPYNGGTTTSEALWQGVPVLCFDGDRWAARQGASLLRAAGLDEFVANVEADYVARGIELGRGFADERMTMRDRLAASRLMDTKAFAREMESIYLAPRSRGPACAGPRSRDVTSASGGDLVPAAGRRGLDEALADAVDLRAEHVQLARVGALALAIGAHERESLQVQDEIVELRGLLRHGSSFVSKRVRSCGLLQHDRVAVELLKLGYGNAGRPDERGHEQGAEQQQPGHRVERGLEAVVECGSARDGTAVGMDVAGRRRRGDRAHRRDADRRRRSGGWC